MLPSWVTLSVPPSLDASSIVCPVISKDFEEEVVVEGERELITDFELTEAEAETEDGEEEEEEELEHFPCTS